MVFHHAIEKAEPSEEVKERVANLIDSVTYSVFMYTSRGLFERDKLTFISQVTFQVLQSSVACYLLYMCICQCGPAMLCTYIVLFPWHKLTGKILNMLHAHSQVLLMNKQIDSTELDFLLRFPAVPNVTSPVDFLSNTSWGGIKALSTMEQFRNLDRDIEARTHTCMYIFEMRKKMQIHQVV